MARHEQLTATAYLEKQYGDAYRVNMLEKHGLLWKTVDGAYDNAELGNYFFDANKSETIYARELLRESLNAQAAATGKTEAEVRLDLAEELRGQLALYTARAEAGEKVNSPTVTSWAVRLLEATLSDEERGNLFESFVRVEIQDIRRLYPAAPSRLGRIWQGPMVIEENLSRFRKATGRDRDRRSVPPEN